MRIGISWHRYYDPASGRYLTPDPIGLAGGINLYSYANQNPVNYIDPYGLWCEIIWGDGSTFVKRTWREEVSIGKGRAIANKVFSQLALLYLTKNKVPTPPIPDVVFDKLFSYQIEYSIYQELGTCINCYEVCYDDCTGEQTSKTYLGRDPGNKSETVLLKRWTETK